MLGTLLKPFPIPRLQKLKDAARNYPCQHCGKIGYTVAAHSNALAHGRGASFKTPDYMVAYLCGDPGGCHDLVDGRAGGLTLEEKRSMWNAAYAKTVALWFIERLVAVT